MRKTFTPLLAGYQARTLRSFAMLYAITEVLFILWWIHDPLQSSSTGGYIITSLLFAYVHTAIWYFFYFTLRMRKLNPSLRIPKFRTALITTRVPSAEPFEVTQKTLLAMLKQDYRYKYDVWLADEDPTSDVKKWCKQHNVKISTRKSNPKYHNAQWPRRKKCKEGNLAYFYDHYGYDNYDIVVQFDSDHVPKKDYVRRVVKAFNDPTVGYAAAPSICSSNAQNSWSARGRLYTEASMHGAYQAGLNDGFVPLCIGSHYTVRTKALKSIGGIGPELAEDFSTTFLMNQYGWNGAFVHNAIAVGDGPQTFADCMKQEFQWSRSLTNLLLTIVPLKLKGFSFKKRLQLRYAVFWYPLIALTSIIGYSLPIIAIVSGKPIVTVNYAEYLYIVTLQILVVIATVTWLRNQGVFRPANAKVVSWEGVLYNLARWPYIVWGIIHSFFDVFSKRENIFKITPKHKDNRTTLKLTQLIPYILLVIIPAVSVVIFGDKNAVAGYYYLTMLTSIFYLVLTTVILNRQIKEAAESLMPIVMKTLALVGLSGITYIGIISSQDQIQMMITQTFGVLF